MPLAFPKPKDKKREPRPAVKVYDDGREVCAPTPAGDREYKRRIEVMRRRQNKLCCDCRLHLMKEAATFEHEGPRRMGGGFRDDRLYIRDEQGRLRRLNGAAHVSCNNERGSKRTPLYQPKYRKAR